MRVRKIASCKHYLRHVCLSLRRSAGSNSAYTEPISVKFDSWGFIEIYRQT